MGSVIKMKVPFATFLPMHNEIRKDLDNAYNQVLDRSYFIQGEECTKFEEEFAAYLAYHLARCEKEDLFGYSAHMLYICKKNEE